MSDLGLSCQTVSNLVSALVFELSFDNKLRNMNFKLYWISLMFYNYRNMSSDQNWFQFFYLNCIFWHYYRNSLEFKKFLMIFRYIQKLQ